MKIISIFLKNARDAVRKTPDRSAVSARPFAKPAISVMIAWNLSIILNVTDSIYCILLILSDLKNIGKELVVLSPGDKITQMLCIDINYVSVEEVDSEFDLYGGVSTERGTGGFGSTGNK